MPNTRSTSGTVLMSLSVCCSSSDALEIDRPGSADGMYTNAKSLLKGGLDLVVSAWKEAAPDWNWSQMDRYITHQVSSVHTNAIVKAAKLDPTRVPTTFPRYGNVGPASIPITLVEERKHLQRGDRVLLMGVGSGLNTAMLELAW